MLFSSGSWSAEIQGELKTFQTDIKMGDVVKATLEVWPANIENVERINEYTGNRFLDHFYLSKINKISQSENNEDYIVAELILVPLSNPEPFSILRLGDENVNIKIDFSVIEVSLDPEKQINVWQASIDPSFLEVVSGIFSLDSRYLKYRIGFISLLLIVIGLFLKFGRRKVKIEKTVILKWDELNQREDFERKYFELKSKIDPIENSEVENFKKIIEEILYIKEWNEEVYRNLKAISEKVKDGVH